MKTNLLSIFTDVVQLVVIAIAIYCFTLPAQAQNQPSPLLTAEHRQKIEQAVWRWSVDTQNLLETIHWLDELTRNTPESSALGELSRLKFMHAQLETNKRQRIHLFEQSIAAADRALTLNPNHAPALFWKAVAMGKIVEDSGIFKALKRMRPMEKLLLRVVELDERYENAGAHRALGRIYHLLPAFPISFGNNQKAYTHLKRARALFPDDLITRAFYADLLFDLGKKTEARLHAQFVLTAPIAEEEVAEFAQYVNIARTVASKTGNSLAQLDTSSITVDDY